MAESILKDQKRILPCAAYCDKEYDVGGYYVGVPVMLGTAGVEKVIEIQLTAEEKAAFDRSVDAVKELVEIIKL
jgi:malate dehydrogenase